jgi:hypothetical protein
MIESCTVRARYVTGKAMTQEEQNEWVKGIKQDEAVLNSALRLGYVILQSWPSVDHNFLNILLYKPDKAE